MAKKKKKNKKENISLEKEENITLPVEIDIVNWVGKTITVSSSDFTGKVKSQKIINRGLTKNNKDDTMLLLYFEGSNFSCNAKIVKEVI